MAVAIGFVAIVLAQSDSDSNKATAQPIATSASSTATTNSASPSSAAVCKTWKMKSTTPGNGNWIDNGVAEIQTAKTKADAMKAGLAWLNAVKAYPGEINGAALYLLNKPVNTGSLVDKNGCATEAAVNAMQVLKTYMELHPPTVAQAPATAVNTGTSNGAVVANTSAGITGNLKAIAMVGANGKTVYVLARCGNAVTTGTPPVPVKPAPKCVPSAGNNYCGHPTCTSNCTTAPPSCKSNCTTTPPSCTTCTPPPSGKHASNAPKPTGGPVVTPPAGGYIDRTGAPHTTPYVPPTNTNPNPGKTDSGRGATNTAPPSAVPTPSATVTVPKTDSPTTNPVAPPPAGF